MIVQSHTSGVLSISFFVEFDERLPSIGSRMDVIEAPCVSAKLLHRTRSKQRDRKSHNLCQNLRVFQRKCIPKCVTGSYKYPALILHEPKTYLGQVGGFPDSVDATEGDDVGLLISLGLDDVANDVDASLGGEKFHEGLGKCLLHGAVDAGERAKNLPFQVVRHAVAELYGHVCCHIF